MRARAHTHHKYTWSIGTRWFLSYSFPRRIFNEHGPLTHTLALCWLFGVSVRVEYFGHTKKVIIKAATTTTAEHKPKILRNINSYEFTGTLYTHTHMHALKSFKHFIPASPHAYVISLSNFFSLTLSLFHSRRCSMQYNFWLFFKFFCLDSSIIFCSLFLWTYAIVTAGSSATAKKKRRV